MTSRLREELHRIADDAPEIGVAPDLWQRARRARVRARTVTIVAAAACLMLIAGLLLRGPWRIDHATPISTDDNGLAVPDHLYAVPEWLSARNNDDTWMRKEVSSDLVVGRAAAAFTTPEGLPVVVDAASGGYHLLDLPGFLGNRWMTVHGLFDGRLGLSLSPDGRRLAYGYAVFGPDAATEPIPSGVRVLDLTTGAIREIPLPGEEGTFVEQINWSPSGSWLVWSGGRLGSWTASSMGRVTAAAGVVAPAATRSRSVSFRQEDGTAWAVDDDGSIAAATQTRLLQVSADGTRRVHDIVPAGFPTGAAVHGGHAYTLHDPDGSTAPPSLYVDGRPRGPVLALGERNDLLAVLDDHRLLVDEERLNGPGRIETISFDTGAGSTDAAILVDPGVRAVSLAYQLLAHGHPVRRPAPDWPWSPDRRAWTAVLGGAGVLLLLGAAVAWWRRRRNA